MGAVIWCKVCQLGSFTAGSGPASMLQWHTLILAVLKNHYRAMCEGMLDMTGPFGGVMLNRLGVGKKHGNTGKD